MEVKNFKSYGGVRIIGPFVGFTAVIGPNGAGKSNVMDAVAFVTGVNSKDLRGKQLKDLIYRSTTDTGDEERSASVALVFERDGKETVFKRSITSAGIGAPSIKHRTPHRLPIHAGRQHPRPSGRLTAGLVSRHAASQASTTSMAAAATRTHTTSASKMRAS